MLQRRTSSEAHAERKIILDHSLHCLFGSGMVELIDIRFTAIPTAVPITITLSAAAPVIVPITVPAAGPTAVLLTVPTAVAKGTSKHASQPFPATKTEYPSATSVPIAVAATLPAVPVIASAVPAMPVSAATVTAVHAPSPATAAAVNRLEAPLAEGALGLGFGVAPV